MKCIGIDIETYSDVELGKCGVYKYAQSANFEILLFAYAVDGGPVEVVDLASGEHIPDAVLLALSDINVTKWAFNCQFERVCLSEYLRRFYPEKFSSYGIADDSVVDYLSPENWKCSMIWSAYMGLPQSLAGVGAVLGLEEQKLTEGKDLIRYFCVPCRSTKSNGGRNRNLPLHDIAKWRQFIFYNKRDVEVEQAIQKKLAHFPVPENIWLEFWLDQEINDRGIAVDMDVASHAVELDERSREKYMKELQLLTGLDNPNSVMQLKEWLKAQGIITDSLDKKSVRKLLATASSAVMRVLELRQLLAKSSVKKYQAMEKATCRDNRVRGMFRFYGANRTGRWAGRLVQLQNLPQNHIADLTAARSLVRTSSFEAMEILYTDVPGILSQLIRTAFVPRMGMKFIVVDFSAIEARVLSYLAKETWRNRVFADNGDIYCASASAMFGVPVEKHGRNAELRQKGKIAELALGYGGAVGALTAMGALEMGINEDELQPLVDSWRAANSNIVAFWWDVDRCIKEAIKRRISTHTHGVKFIYQSGMLFIELPSGRRLAYVKPQIGENRFGGESVTYEGIGISKKWERLESYGPKFVENIVQAISRDILAYAMRTLSYCFICGHVHDELIIECCHNVSLKSICEQMGRTPQWLPGLLLRADGYECDFYKKD